MALKKYLPKSLFWRSVLILVLPILLLQAVVAAAILSRHYDGVTGQMAEAVARELNVAIGRSSGPRIWRRRAGSWRS